jgi:acetoin utilization deacetylase AcuC-like enzyme
LWGSAEANTQRAKPATKQEMCQFHSDDYIDFLSKVTPENMAAFSTQQTKCMLLILCRAYFSQRR